MAASNKSTRDELEQQYRQVCEIVRRDGICIVVLPPVGELTSVAFSIGGAAKGHPDVITYGLPYEVGNQTVFNACRILSENWPFQDRSKFTGVFDGYEAAFRNVSNSNLLERAMLLTAVFNTRQGLKPAGILQVCWPDKAGKFPFEPDCDSEVAALQRVRGLRS